MPSQESIQLQETDAMESSVLGQTSYAFSRQKLNEIIKKLRDCGTEGVIRLPKIAVVGNQSAGKSSLIEAISQIKVPRASGTCTRCPMEVVLSSDRVAWKCKISLRVEHGRIDPFAETTNKDEVPIFLRRAQLAILNPHKASQEFVHLDESECQNHSVSVPFSQNTVVVEISGADVDVTFIDLPGIIANTERTEDERFIQLIQDLAVSYVSQEECLILLTISMKDDIDNQSAAKMARKWDPNGLRTIGVLTKADTVQEGEYEPWLKIMNGNSHVLRRGYYVTRLPGPTKKEMDQTPKQVRDKETGFFSRPPWSQLNKNRLGIEKLTEALSEGLAGMIRDRLPGLQEELLLKKKKVQEDLDCLPESFADSPQAKLLLLCGTFNAEIYEYITAKPDRTTFFHNLQEEFSKLEKRIMETRPNFEIEPASDASKVVPLCATVLSLSGEGVNSDKKGEGEKAIALSAVREVIRQISVRALPDYIPIAVFEYFINMFVSEWTFICLESFLEVEQLLKTLLQEVCLQHFNRFRSSGLLHEVKFCLFDMSLIGRTVTHAILARTADQTRTLIQFFCKMERHRPFTLNYDQYRSSRADFTVDFADRRMQNNGPRPPLAFATHTLKDVNGNAHSISSKGVGEDVLLSLLTAQGYHVSSAKQLARLHDPDEFDAELDVMARVLAYFEISSKRIIDVMPMIFETALVCNFADELQKVLTTDLKLIGEFGFQNCRRYGKDEPDIQGKRQEYMKHEEILTDAILIISGVFNK